MPKKLNRLLITGASGALGSHCRKHVKDIANTIRVTDKAEISDNPGSNSKMPEEVIRCDLSDYEAVLKLVDGCDGILHFGGQATEADWKTVKTSNIEGIYNLYEAARIKGCKRIFFASSIHAIGFHPLTKKIDDKASIRPDTLYGASKAFGKPLPECTLKNLVSKPPVLELPLANPHHKITVCSQLGLAITTLSVW